VDLKSFKDSDFDKGKRLVVELYQLKASYIGLAED